MKRKTQLAALAVAGALLLSGCTAATEENPAPSAAPTGTVQPVQTGTFSLAYDPKQTMHPITGTNGANLELGGLVYQGLYELDQSFQPQPRLCAGATAGSDGLTWTVEVAQGVCFSDGTPLTAAHVVSSLETARTATRYQNRLSGVTGVAQTGTYTLTITLSRPNANLPALLDIPVVLEREGQDPLGTGPYLLQDGALVPNPYSGLVDALPAETIPLVEVSTPDRRKAAFDSGEVWMATTQFSDPQAVGYSGTCEVFDYPTSQLLYLGFQTQRGACADAAVRQRISSDLGFQTQRGACADAAVRQRISSDLNRDSLVQVQLSGHGDPTPWPISPAWGELPEWTQGGTEEAAGGSLTLIVNEDNSTRQQVAQAVANQLEGAGFTVTVKSLAWEDYVSALERGNFDLYLGQVQLTSDFDLTALLTGSLSYGGTQSEVQELLNAWRRTGGETELEAYLAGFAQQGVPCWCGGGW